MGLNPATKGLVVACHEMGRVVGTRTVAFGEAASEACILFSALDVA